MPQTQLLFFFWAGEHERRSPSLANTRAEAPGAPLLGEHRADAAAGLPTPSRRAGAAEDEETGLCISALRASAVRLPRLKMPRPTKRRPSRSRYRNCDEGQARESRAMAGGADIDRRRARWHVSSSCVLRSNRTTASSRRAMAKPTPPGPRRGERERSGPEVVHEAGGVHSSLPEARHGAARSGFEHDVDAGFFPFARSKPRGRFDYDTGKRAGEPVVWQKRGARDMPPRALTRRRTHAPIARDPAAGRAPIRLASATARAWVWLAGMSSRHRATTCHRGRHDAAVVHAFDTGRCARRSATCCASPSMFARERVAQAPRGLFESETALQR